MIGMKFSRQLMALICLSCIHSKDSDKKKLVIESGDGLIRTEQITMGDTRDAKIDKLLKSAYINYKNNNFAKAIVNYETVRIFATSLDYWHAYALAYCYLTVGKYERSIPILEGLMEDRPEIADTYVLQGFNYLRLGKPTVAINQFNRALNLENHPPRTYYYLSLAKKRINPKFEPSSSISLAKAEYLEILAKNPNDFETLIEYSYLFTMSGDLKSARDYLEKAKNALNLSPEIEEITYQESLAPYQNPIWSSFYLNLIEGLILHREGSTQKSNQTFLIALQNPPGGSILDIAEIYYFISKNFSALKNPEASKKALSLARQFDPMIDFRGDQQVIP